MKLGLLRTIRDYRRFTGLPPAARAITFYAEEGSAWGHLGPIVETLTSEYGIEVAYLTSSPDDPILEIAPKGVHAFFIGTGTVRTLAFINLSVPVCVMTMPDLETFHLKRSRSVGTHYVYVFHSMVSTHMIYRPEAFDHYDSLLCVGPHHLAEVREREAVMELPHKKLVEHGYGRLDTILRDSPSNDGPSWPDRPLRVLVAPTWAPEGLLERHGEALIDALRDSDFEVVIRPHPETARRRPDAIEKIRATMSDRMVLETSMASRDSLLRSDVMIGDWSGAALEYAFGLERPVLFIDVPQKVNNPDYERLTCVPVEVSIRSEIGRVLSPRALDELPTALEDIAANAADFRERIKHWRERTVFHVGNSGAVGAKYLARLAREATP